MADVALPTGPASETEGPTLEAIRFSDIPAWLNDHHGAAFRTFLASARAIADAPPKTRSLGVDGIGLQRIARAALATPTPLTGDGAREFFEHWFVPHRLNARGFVTGYYEPEVDASRHPTERFTVPLYRRPPELVDVTEAERPPGWDPELRFARRASTGLEPFFDRAAIDDGALAGRGLELAFVENPVDAFFIHVQGSARLRLVDGPGQGTTLRIAFDGKAGHAYTAIGRLAVERGILAREAADKDGLEAWLKSHPIEGRALMRENRSFIFFRATALAENEGPLGAGGVSLTAGRSLAVDRTLHTFHTPIFVATPGLADPEEEGKSFARLMIAQDTGSAIVGPARGDLFFGSRADAGSRAGRVRHAATMIALVPTTGARE